MKKYIEYILQFGNLNKQGIEMITGEARKSGSSITVTSSTANIPYPFVAVYAATKSALKTWTEGLSYELSGLV